MTVPRIENLGKIPGRRQHHSLMQQNHPRYFSLKYRKKFWGNAALARLDHPT
jgi:hypothetical protein